jgi:hypothetical protein
MEMNGSAEAMVKKDTHRLITVRKGTLFSLLQKTQIIESLGTITETHESFFWRKYSTAEV